MARNMRALVMWTKEGKTGIEPLNHVPENSRLVDSVTGVQYSGDKKWYPAKILMISDDLAALEKRADEVALQLTEEMDLKAKGPHSKLRAKKRNSKAPSPSKASDRDVAQALGHKPPTPAELKTTKEEAAKSRKLAASCHASVQNRLEKVAMARKSLFVEPSKNAVNEDSDHINESDADESDAENSTLDAAAAAGYSSDGSTEIETPGKSKWCSCNVCELLQRHCNPGSVSLMKALCSVFDSSPLETRYLKLLPVPDRLKKVELSLDKGVYISQADKDMLKVDYHNKASSLIRETLFILYGKDAFINNKITAKGQKLGTFGIEDNVLKAVWGFVNRHVDKKLLFKQFVGIINKRAPEWQKKSESPASGSKHQLKFPKPSEVTSRKRTKTSGESILKVVSTSPFKCNPLKSPTKPAQSPSKLPKQKPSVPDAVHVGSVISSMRMTDSPVPPQRGSQQDQGGPSQGDNGGTPSHQYQYGGPPSHQYGGPPSHQYQYGGPPSHQYGGPPSHQYQYGGPPSSHQYMYNGPPSQFGYWPHCGSSQDQSFTESDAPLSEAQLQSL